MDVVQICQSLSYKAYTIFLSNFATFLLLIFVLNHTLVKIKALDSDWLRSCKFISNLRANYVIYEENYRSVRFLKAKSVIHSA